MSISFSNLRNLLYLIAFYRNFIHAPKTDGYHGHKRMGAAPVLGGHIDAAAPPIMTKGEIGRAHV